MGVVNLLGKLIKGSGNREKGGFLYSIERKRPLKKVEDLTSRYLDTLENMIKIKTSEKLFNVDFQDDIKGYYELYNKVDRSLKQLKKYCLAMEKIEKSGLETMMKDYNNQREVLKKQIDFITSMKPVNDNYYDIDIVNGNIQKINKAIDAINKLRRSSKFLKNPTEYKKLENYAREEGKKLEGNVVGEKFIKFLNEQTKYRDKNVEEAKKYVEDLINSKEETTKEEKIKACKQEITEKINESVELVGLKKFDLEAISNILDDGFNPDGIYANFVNVSVADKIVDLARGGNIIQDSDDFKDTMVEELAKPAQERNNFSSRVFVKYFSDISSKKIEAANKAANEEKTKSKKAIDNDLAKYIEKFGNDIIEIKDNIDGFITSFASKWDGVKKSFAEFKNVKNAKFDDNKKADKLKKLNEFIEKYNEQLDIIRDCCIESKVYKKNGKIVKFDAKVKGKNGALRSVKINGFNNKNLDAFMNNDNTDIDDVLLEFNRGFSKINEEIRKYEGYLSKAKKSAEEIKNEIKKYVGGYGEIFGDSGKGFSNYVVNGVIDTGKLRSLDYTNIPASLTLARAIIIFYKYIDDYEQNDFNIFKTDNNNDFIKSYLEERDKLKLGSFSPKEIAEVKAAVEK